MHTNIEFSVPNSKTLYIDDSCAPELALCRYKAIMTENRKYRAQQYAARAEVDAEGLLKVWYLLIDVDF